jgi:hypothetical protein
LERKQKEAVEVYFEELPRYMPGWLKKRIKLWSGHPICGRDFNTGSSVFKAGVLPPKGPRNLVCRLRKFRLLSITFVTVEIILRNDCGNATCRTNATIT